MGVSIDVWRARIGLFCTGSCRSLTASCSIQNMFSFMSQVMAASVILMCLVIGNIELNPGPEFKCPFAPCIFKSQSLKTVAYHEQIHSNQKNFVFRCPSVLCYGKNFLTYSGLLNHVKESHGTEDRGSASHQSTAPHQVECPLSECQKGFPKACDLFHHILDHLGTNTVMICPMCNLTSKFCDTMKFRNHFSGHISDSFVPRKCQAPSCEDVPGTYDEMLEHCCEHLSRNVSFKCPLRAVCGSANSFYDLQNLRSHLSIKHVGWRGMERNPNIKNVSSTYLRAPPSLLAQSSGLGDVDETPDVEDENPITADMFFKHLGHFYFMLLAEYFLPDTTVDVIAQRMKLISELVQYQFRYSLSKELKSRNVKEEDVDDILNSVFASDVFFASHHKDSPGPTYTTRHLREQYMKHFLNYVKPVDVPLDEDRDDGAVAQLIPPEEVLALLLKDQSVQEKICESFHYHSTEGLFQDYKDGSKCRMAEYCERIDLIIFQDGFNPVNALGSAKNKYKMNGTYFTIGNLPPCDRSKVDSINLAYLVESKYLSDVKNYGPLKCFKPIINRFKRLETTGIEFMGRRVPVCVQYFVGDNLGAHEIGGFIGSFSSEYFCRFCPIKREQFHERPSAVKALRSSEEYFQDLIKLSEVQERRPQVTTYRGVKEDSVLHLLDNFHVCDPRLPPCVAHDVFESGVADRDLFEIIVLLVKKGWFNYLALQQLLSAFVCSGPDKGNKPAQIKSSGGKVGGHAIQNWTLIRLLPFIIQDYIKDPRDEVWQLYLKLKKVVEYACAPAYRRHDLTQLKRLSEQYMRDRARVLPTAPKPKHHFLMHYAHLIPLLGPIIHLFTMRFEAKHQFFKRVTRNCRNFVNLGKTLALRHQVWMAYLLSGSVLSKGVHIKKQKPYQPDMYSGQVKELLASRIVGCEAINCEKIEVDGIKYKTGVYILLGLSTLGDSIDIGKVEVILNAHGVVYFIIHKFKSEFKSDYGVYKIHDTPYGVDCVPFHDLKYPTVQPVYKFQESSCFSVKHFLVMQQ